MGAATVTVAALSVMKVSGPVDTYPDSTDELIVSGNLARVGASDGPRMGCGRRRAGR